MMLLRLLLLDRRRWRRNVASPSTLSFRDMAWTGHLPLALSRLHAARSHRRASSVLLLLLVCGLHRRAGIEVEIVVIVLTMVRSNSRSQ